MRKVNVLLTPVIILFISFTSTIYSQQYSFMPKEISKAYQKVTRSADGNPGKNYWQNITNYKIKAVIEPSIRTLIGEETITYFNNSPDTLKKIIFKLYQNVHKKESARNIELDPNSLTDGIIISKINYDKTSLSLKPEDKSVLINGTNMIVTLPVPLAPKSNTSFDINWSFEIPFPANPRTGAYDSTTFFIGYWYPKIAVYDDINGWDMHQHNGEHEFYNEYGKMDVEIEVPAGFGVWATGTLQNPSEVFEMKYLERYNKSQKSDSVISIISAEDLNNKNIFKSKNGKTIWKFYADYIPDFAFGVSDHYLYDAVSTEIEKGRRVLIQSAYNPESKFFFESALVAKKTIEMLSTDIPGVAYPYPTITVFNGDGGMEFPMIVNDGIFPSRLWDIYVTTHEISHMYFPFYVGTNETKYAWMDEGWAYMLPYDIQLSFEPYDHRIRAAKGYANFAGKENDIPMFGPSTLLRDPDLSMLSYYKPGVAYDILLGVLGKQKFKLAMKTYIERWNGKHPTPYDFLNCFGDAAGEDLSWYFNPWFLERGIPDVGISSVNQSSDKVEIRIMIKGNLPIPVAVKVKTETGDEIKLYETAYVWKKGNKEIILTAEVNSKIISAELGDDKIPDSDLTNNKWSLE